MASERANPTPSRVRALLGGWPRGWRRTVILCLIPVWLGAAVGVAMRWWDSLGAVPMFQALFPVAGAVAILVLVISACTRVGWAILAALAVAAAPLVLTVQSLVADTVTASSDDEVVLTVNMEYGSARPAELVARVEELDVDTLVLLEITPGGWSGLRAAGLQRLLPHSVGEPEEGAGGSIIRSTHPLEAVAGDDADEVYESFSQPIARVRRESGPYLLRAVHPYPPVPSMVSPWHRQLGQLGEWQARQTEEPLVLAGDFNASASHPIFRTAFEGLTDAQAATGAGWVRTWPVGKMVPPFVAIDHIMVRDFGVVDAGDITVSGTDHKGVWARLRLG